MIDSSLSAHAGVHLRQQRGRDLHKGHATHVAGCCKARHIANHTATQCKQHGLAVAAMAQQCIKNLVQRLPVLVRLPIRQYYGMYVGIFGCQCGLKLGRI